VLRNHVESLRRKDGTILHTLQNITAVRDAQGKIKQFRGLMLDVTEQRTFQAQLQRERDFNQKILNATQSMILVLDTAGLISYANRRCYETGYKQDEMIGRRLVDLVDAGQRKDFEAALDTTAHGQQVENLELRARRSDGSSGHFSISLSPMRDEQNTVNSVVVVMTDITDAALLQAKLAHSERMATLGRLVSGVAHEVNNPLAAILGFTDLLLENPGVPANAREDLQIILHETQRTKDIVQDLLSFARQRAVKRELVNVGAVLKQTTKLRSYDLQSHGVEVIEEYDENLPAVMGDAQQLQQVFLNILNNAYDAIEESGRAGRILLKTSATQDGSIEISLADNGTGIVDVERIFDPFYTTKPTGKGTGLGLSICYGIVRAHGGEIQCSNNADGLGSTFSISIPVAVETANASASAKQAGR
jgi:two-component system NtrC family sensor kinase